MPDEELGGPVNGKWVRILSPQEEFSHTLYEKNCLVISYVLRFCTSRQLTEQDAKTVFTSLYRKCPNLRLGLQRRGDELWFRERTEEKIDFEVIPDADVNKVFHDMSHYRFKAKGPIWAARLLPWAPEQSDYVDSIKLDADNRGKHPHVSHVVIAYHHAITDGFSCHLILRAVMCLFDNVLSGKEIDDTEQIGVFLDTTEETMLFKEIEAEFRNDNQLFEIRKTSYESCQMQTLLEEGYPIQAKIKPETVCIAYILDKATSRQFTARCKKEGVTFNSGFSAVLNTAIVSLLLKENIERDVYKISAIQTINKRSYYEDCKNSLGCGMGCMDITIDVPKDVLGNFWSHARQLHRLLKDQRAMKNCFEQYVIERMTGSSPLESLDVEGMDVPLPPMTYYGTSNLLDVTKQLGNAGDHIQLEYYDRLTATHLLASLFQSIFQSFQGQLMHSLQYNVQLMDADTAQLLSDTLFKIVADVI